MIENSKILKQVTTSLEETRSKLEGRIVEFKRMRSAKVQAIIDIEKEIGLIDMSLDDSERAVAALSAGIDKGREEKR
jgi:hypothetical protein